MAVPAANQWRAGSAARPAGGGPVSLVRDLHVATAAHLAASKASDAADEAYWETSATLFPDPAVIARQAQADNERLRTFERLHELRWRLAWGA